MASTTDGVNIFQNIATDPKNKNIWYFRIRPTHVGYANTLRRLVITDVETVGFRADLTESGTTADVLVEKNTTPMTNEMLAHRVGLLPIHITEPLKFEKDKYLFELNEVGAEEQRDVTSSDFTVYEILDTVVAEESGNSDNNNNNEDNKNDNNNTNMPASLNRQRLPTERFFPPNPLTGDTCIIATFKPAIHGKPSAEEITIKAKASIGTGRENARFNPVSQCSYIYTRDTDNVELLKSTYEKWLINHKKVSPESLKEDGDRAASLEREFNTCEIAKVYLMDPNGEPFSFDFTVQTIGVLSVPYIIQRACEVGEARCLKYANLVSENIEGVKIRPADARIRGYDITFVREDHTLGNLLQTWLDQNMVGKGVVTFAGYKVPHPLTDEMLLRVGVEDGKEATAREVVAQAARSCAAMLRSWKTQWQDAVNRTKRGATTGAPTTGKRYIIKK